MSDLGSGPVWGPQEEQKIKRNLSRLYWIFFILALIFAAYMVGWFMAWTGSCVCKV